MIIQIFYNGVLADLIKMTRNNSPLENNPIYLRSPWLPRGAVRKSILLCFIVLGAYGSSTHWSFFFLIVFSIIILSPKILLATAYYYGKSALYLGQLFSK